MIPSLALMAWAIAPSAIAATLSQNSLITQNNADYLYWQAEAFDRVEAPDEANLWRINFNPPPGTIGTSMLSPAPPAR